MRQIVESWVNNNTFQKFIMVVIIINAITLGLETVHNLSDDILHFLHIVDTVALTIFVVELFMKLFAYGFNFFKRPWCVFDFIIVSVSLVPATGNFSIIRALRVLRVLKIISTMPKLRHIVSSFLNALPGVGAVGVLFSIIFYVFSVMSVQLFGTDFFDYFGTIPAAMFTLFQIMTLEAWGEIVREIMVVYPWAGLYFIGYILIASFILINMIVAVIVNVMGEGENNKQDDMLKNITKELKALRKEVKTLKK